MSYLHRPIADVFALEELLPELDKPRITSVRQRRQAREVLVETCSSVIGRQHCWSCVFDSKEMDYTYTVAEYVVIAIIESDSDTVETD